MPEIKTVILSPRFSLSGVHLRTFLEHTILPLLAQGAVAALQGLDLTHLTPYGYIIVSSLVQGLIHLLQQYLNIQKVEVPNGPSK